jgi:hypothetical protein
VKGNTFSNWAVVLAAAVALPACATSNPGETLSQVNYLITSIERVHTDTELARQRVHQAAVELQKITAFDFKGDVVGVYTSFANSVKAESKQLELLGNSVNKMKEVAEPVFKQWAKDLESFASIDLRLKSQQRLTDTRQQYDAILSTAGLAQAAYKTFDGRLRDYSTYLKSDFNAGSVAAITKDVKAFLATASAPRRALRDLPGRGARLPRVGRAADPGADQGPPGAVDQARAALERLIARAVRPTARAAS